MALRHDQLLKQLLREFFAEFLDLFFPDVAQSLDFSRVDFLDKEAFTDLPEGSRREMDLVARTRRLDGQPEVILIHLELQARRTRDFPYRLNMVECFLPLNDSEQQEFSRLVATEEFGAVAEMLTIYEERAMERGIQRGIEQGIEQGLIEGQRRALLQVLKAKFGSVPEPTQQAVNAPQTEEELARLTERAATASSLSEVGLPA